MELMVQPARWVLRVLLEQTVSRVRPVRLVVPQARRATSVRRVLLVLMALWVLVGLLALLARTAW
jgi:hypothetical protein